MPAINLGMPAAPAPVLAAVLAQVQPHLTQPEWTKLMRSLGLPVVPGLVH